MSVSYKDGFIENPNELLNTLWNGLSWEKREDAPRRETWSNDYNRSYTYGKGAGERTYNTVPWHSELLKIRDKIKDETGFYLEACFSNGYENEKHALGWHSDNDPGIDHSKPIVVISLGAERFIYFREIGGSEINKIFLKNGSILIMNPGTQFTHEHKIPKHFMKCGPRVSLTYRGLIKGE